MKYLEQKPGPLWWTKNPRTTLYMIREFSSILIALATLTLGFVALLPVIGYIGFGGSNLVYGVQDFAKSEIFKITICIGLVGSLIHTFTWLAVMPKLLPIKLPKAAQSVAYLIFLAIWLGLSYLVLTFILP